MKQEINFSLATNFIAIIKEASIWSEPLVLKRGDYLGGYQRTDTQVYWVEEGLFRIISTLKSKECGMRFAYSGEFFSRLDSYIKSVPSRYQVMALRKSVLRVASKKDFEQFLSNHPSLKVYWQEMLYQLIYEMLEREDDLMINDPKARLARVLNRSPRLFQEVPHKYIAAYLRMSPETLSRLMNS